MSLLPSATHANESTSYYALADGGGGSASNWSTFPAVSTINASSNAITNVSSLQIDAQVLTANASSLFLNGVPVATISGISNVSDWVYESDSQEFVKSLSFFIQEGTLVMNSYMNDKLTQHVHRMNRGEEIIPALFSCYCWH